MPAHLSDVELLRRLVGFDSTSCNSNLPIADFIANYLDRPGVRVERNPSPDGLKANLIVMVGPEGDGTRAGLVLSGHMDVVPAGEDGWRSDPFTLTERDGAYVGRGTADMKGFLSLAVNRAAMLESATLRRPLVLVLTYDEELGTLGAKHLVETWPNARALPRYVVIGEPTALRVVRMHKGYLKFRLTVEGKSAHSGYPHLGRNAIEPAGRAIVALSELRRELERERPPHSEYFPEVPYAALNVGRVAGGVAINVVPDRCAVELGVRLLPDMASPPMIERVRGAVAAALGDVPWSLEVLGDSPPMQLDERSRVYRALCEEVGQAETFSASFATDAGWLQRAGLECVLFGPGSIEVAHQPNEWLPAPEFRRAGEILERMIDRFCRS